MKEEINIKDMDYDEIIAEIRKRATHESEFAPSFTLEGLLSVKIKMKNNHNITIYCNANEDCIDCASTSYIGVSATKVEPLKEIEKMEFEWE